MCSSSHFPIIPLILSCQINGEKYQNVPYQLFLKFGYEWRCLYIILWRFLYVYVCFCMMDPNVCFLVWRGVFPCQTSCSMVVVYFAYFALCQTCSILPAVSSQFLEGVESRLSRSCTAQMMALSSLSQVADCCIQDSHLLHCMVVVAFLLLFVSAMKHCESFWPILLPPANSLFSILWPTQADSLNCRVCLPMPAHRVCFQFSFCRQQHLSPPSKY